MPLIPGGLPNHVFMQASAIVCKTNNWKTFKNLCEITNCDAGSDYNMFWGALGHGPNPSICVWFTTPWDQKVLQVLQHQLFLRKDKGAHEKPKGAAGVAIAFPPRRPWKHKTLTPLKNYQFVTNSPKLFEFVINQCKAKTPPEDPPLSNNMRLPNLFSDRVSTTKGLRQTLCTVLFGAQEEFPPWELIGNEGVHQNLCSILRWCFCIRRNI